MRKEFVAVLLTGLLVSCNVHSSSPPSTRLTPLATSSVEWGERLTFSKSVKAPIVKNPAGMELSRQVFHPPRAFVDLPSSPTFPVVGLEKDPLNLTEYRQKPSLSQQRLDTHRGSVEVILSDNSKRTLTPYSAVQSGRVHVLAGVTGACTPFYSFLNGSLGSTFGTLATLSIPDSGGSNLCHMTLDIKSQDTASALSTLNSKLTL